MELSSVCLSVWLLLFSIFYEVHQYFPLFRYFTFITIQLVQNHQRRPGTTVIIMCRLHVNYPKRAIWAVTCKIALIGDLDKEQYLYFPPKSLPSLGEGISKEIRIGEFLKRAACCYYPRLTYKVVPGKKKIFFSTFIALVLWIVIFHPQILIFLNSHNFI